MWYIEVLHRSAQQYEKTLPENERISSTQFDLLKKQFLSSESILRRGFFYIKKRPIGQLFNDGNDLPLDFIYQWIEIFTFLANPKNLFNSTGDPFTVDTRLRALARTYTASFALCIAFHLEIDPNDTWKYIIEPNEAALFVILMRTVNHYDTYFSFRKPTPATINNIQQLLTESERLQAKAHGEKKSFVKSTDWCINAAIAKIQNTFHLSHEQLIQLNNLFQEIRLKFSLEAPTPVTVSYHALYQFFRRINLLQKEKAEYNAENIALIFFLSFFAAMQCHEEGIKLSHFILEAREPYLFERATQTLFSHCQLLDFKLEVNCSGNNDIKDIYDALSADDKKLFLDELSALNDEEYTFKNDLLNSLTNDAPNTNEVDDCGFSKSALQFFHRYEYKPMDTRASPTFGNLMKSQ